jgi:protein SCO1/2
VQKRILSQELFVDTRIVSLYPLRPSRRLFLAGAAATLASHALGAQDVDSGHGRLRPAVTVPDFEMVLANGSRASLQSLLAGQGTAIQLMFTECRTTCPMEGAIFEKVQTLIPNQVERRLQLLSLSVNASGERPGALGAWLERYHARPGWMAAAPSSKDLPAFRKLFGQGRSASDPHSTQVQVVDRHGQLIWRTSELPSASEIVSILERL